MQEWRQWEGEIHFISTGWGFLSLLHWMLGSDGEQLSLKASAGARLTKGVGSLTLQQLGICREH